MRRTTKDVVEVLDECAAAEFEDTDVAHDVESVVREPSSSTTDSAPM
jgi:hypothetical protein